MVVFGSRLRMNKAMTTLAYATTTARLTTYAERLAAVANVFLQAKSVPVLSAPVDPCTLPTPPAECNPDPCAQPNPPAECNEDVGYGGQFVLNPIVQHECSVGGVFAIVSIALSQLIFTETATGLTITSFSQTDMPPLRQMPMPNDGTFDAVGQSLGDCDETYRLTGAFTDSTRREFNATFSASYSGGSSCALTNCTSGSQFDYEVNGLRVGP